MPSGYGGIGAGAAAQKSESVNSAWGAGKEASSFGSSKKKKKDKIAFTPPKDFNDYRGGVIGRSVTDPNTGRDWKGTWNPYGSEDGADQNNYGFWSFAQDPSKEPFYDPTLPPGYMPRGAQPPSQTTQMGMEALLALLNPGGSGGGRARTPSIGGTRYVNGGGGYANFLNRGNF